MIAAKLFIAGEYVDAVDGSTFDSIDPSNDQVFAKVAAAKEADVELAVIAAEKLMERSAMAVFEGKVEQEGLWGIATTGAQRAKIIRKFGALVNEHIDELYILDVLDMGKAKREAYQDILDAVATCDFYATEAEELDHRQNEEVSNGTDGEFYSRVQYDPVGVVGAISPWNYPFLMGIWKVMPALAAGNAVILKPSEFATLSCLKMGELFNKAGLPKGAFSVLSGMGYEAGAALSNHPRIDKITFTGSLPTAQHIMSKCALGPRPVSLELGGKSPLIVLDDADVPAAVEWALTGFLWGSGQVCSATSRVLVHESVREQFLSLLQTRLDTIKVMAASEGGDANFIGPVVNRAQHDRIWNYIRTGMADGVKVFYHKEESLPATYRENGQGCFVAPTVFLDVPTDNRLWREEIFGPVVCIRSFATDVEAITVANDSDYGLAAAIFTTDEIRLKAFTRVLRVGIVWHNCSQPTFVQTPWGGVKKSGFGRDLGRWSVEEHLAVKQVTGCQSGHTWQLW